MRTLWVIVSAAIAAACVVGGLLLGWIAVQQPVLRNLTVSDSIELWTTEPRADFSLFWELAPSGTVQLTVTRLGPGNYLDGAAEAIVVLACDARLNDIEPVDDSYGVDPDSPYVVEESLGNAQDCGQLGKVHPAYQLIRTSLSYQESKVFTGRTYADWTASAGGTRIARTPYAVSIASPSMGGDESTYSTYPRLSDLGAEVPTNVTLSVSLLAHDTEFRESADGPSLTEERVNNTITDWGEGLVESVTWSATDKLLEPGLARWSDPGAQARAQLALLFSGVLLGVAAAVAVETIIEIVRTRRLNSGAAD